MKKYLFLAAALTVMGCGMTSCSSDAEDVIEQNEQAPKLTKLVFTVAQDAQTRASWDGNTPVFDEGDEVSLFSANNNNVKLTAHVTAGVVTLEGEGEADDELYFVYPWNEGVHMDMGTKKITSTTAPAYNLNITANGYPYYGEFLSSVYGINKYPANALSLAKSTDGGRVAITFKGLMAILKFTPTTADLYANSCPNKMWLQIYEDETSSTTFKGGQLTINASGETPTIESTQSSYGIVFEMSGNGTFVVGNTYYVAFPPTDPMETDTYVEDYFGNTITKDIEDPFLSPGFKFEAGKVYSAANHF